MTPGPGLTSAVLTLAFLVLLSFLSYLVLKKKSIPVYPVILLLSAYLFCLLKETPALQYASFLLLAAALFLLGLQDILKRYVELWQVLALLGTAAVFRLTLEDPLWLGLAGGALGFIVMFLPFILTRKQGIGLGDVIVFTVLSLLMTPVEVLVFLLLTAGSGMVYALIVMAFFKKNEKVPLVPFIGVSFIALFTLKKELILLLRLDVFYQLQYMIFQYPR